MRAIIYDTETGEIKRELRGAVPIENQRLGDDESILTDEDAELPERTVGKKVEPSSNRVVEDPDHTSGTDLRQQFRAARESEDVQTQLDTLFEMVTGEQP